MALLTRDIPNSVSVVAAATAYPITVADMARLIKVDDSSREWEVERWLKQAIAMVESDNCVALMTQTLKQTFDCFPGVIELARWPVQSISSITYVDPDGVTQTLSSALYSSYIHGPPVRIRPAYGQSWPGTRVAPEAVAVTFVAGYASIAAVPHEYLECLEYLCRMRADDHDHYQEIYDATRRRVAWRP